MFASLVLLCAAPARAENTSGPIAPERTEGDAGDDTRSATPRRRPPPELPPPPAAPEPQPPIPVTEEPISVEQWRAGCESGEITEVFACGTAAVITPVGAVKGASGSWVIGDGAAGPVTMRLREQLLGIQFGRLPDPHGWVRKVL